MSKHHILKLEPYYTEFLHLVNGEWKHVTESRGWKGCRKPIETNVTIITLEEAKQLRKASPHGKDQ